MDNYSARIPHFCIEHFQDGTVETFLHASLSVEQRYAYMARLLHTVVKDNAQWRVVAAARHTASGVLQYNADAIVADDGCSGAAHVSELLSAVPLLFDAETHVRLRLVPRTSGTVRTAPVPLLSNYTWTGLARCQYEVQRLRLIMSEHANATCTLRIGRHSAAAVTGDQLCATFDRLRMQWMGERDEVVNRRDFVVQARFDDGCSDDGDTDDKDEAQKELQRSLQLQPELKPEPPVQSDPQRPPQLGAVVFDDDGSASPVHMGKAPVGELSVKNIYARHPCDRYGVHTAKTLSDNLLPQDLTNTVSAETLAAWRRMHRHVYEVPTDTIVETTPMPEQSDAASGQMCEMRPDIDLVIRGPHVSALSNEIKAELDRLRDQVYQVQDPALQGARDIYLKHDQKMKMEHRTIPDPPTAREQTDDEWSNDDDDNADNDNADNDNTEVQSESPIRLYEEEEENANDVVQQPPPSPTLAETVQLMLNETRY